MSGPTDRQRHPRHCAGAGVNVEVVATPELGNRSYVISDALRAVVVDPQRDLDRIEAVLDRLGKDVTHVLETHIHNDYVTGGYELARRTGAAYGVNAADMVRFERNPLTDGQILVSGTLSIQVVATPGHTETHLAYVVRDRVPGDASVFSGGSLLYGSVGRTDLVAPARTRELAAAQYRSAHRLAALPGRSPLYPTHGFGSFCSSGGEVPAAIATIADERRHNRALTAVDEDAFVDSLLASLGDYPTYYVEMAPINRRGPSSVDLSVAMPTVTPQQVLARLDAGETVIDVRDRVAYSSDHLDGTTSVSLGPQFATYVGWLVPFGSRVTLLGESLDQLEAARRQLVRIGYDDVSGTVDTVGAARRSYPRETFKTVAAGISPDDVVLDVRRTDERRASHVRGSVHIPLHELPGRAVELQRRCVWVHCGSGFRAGTAASILEQAGFDVVHIDDDYARAVELGLTT